MRAFCVKCNKEQDIIVDQVRTFKVMTKHEGRCLICNAYCCRVVLTGSNTDEKE